MKTEKPKRLEPVKNTLRLLCAYSGNLCAFPGCNHLIFNADGDLIAELCHIEAALPEGERFNPDMTNEDRRDFNNLMFMCHEHHVTTDNVDKYPVRKLKEMKAEHEAIFSLERMSDRIAEKLYDYTSQLTVSTVLNLNNLYQVLGIKNRDKEEREMEVKDFNKQIKIFKNLSNEAKITLITSVQRLKNDFYERQKYVDMMEIGRVLNLYRNELFQYFDELESSGLMVVNEIEIRDNRYENRHQLKSKNRDVDNSFFEEIYEYCELLDIDFREFMLDLDFFSLDD
ncbi:hypothetical protein F941_00570 [Acinetobacter bouvetii DSM 14964 = CIP 107468]|uniref:Uncharacterized protein n=1 Tax=Acinetobacter bouvetii DSM 14964 = CIP 107468 TaxID=1120925 RepID=N9DTR8_9GAMM|nr:hypothetical protein [Acinetobacter bouvetii]ENV83873.1 hypothetical protein F941_00570 [Acinetobacter bouvetii DSM 14964 = CIP 107468]BCU65776.1 hypothetical protein ACBO_25670 [Acinetobacter bouvetii]